MITSSAVRRTRMSPARVFPAAQALTGSPTEESTEWRCSARAATRRQGARLPMPRTNHAARGHAPRRPPREHALRPAPGAAPPPPACSQARGRWRPQATMTTQACKSRPCCHMHPPHACADQRLHRWEDATHLFVRHGLAAVHLACCQERLGTRGYQHLARPAQASQARRYRCRRCHQSRMSWSAWRPSGPSLRMQAGAVTARSASWPP